MKRMQPINQRSMHVEIQSRIKQYIIDNKLKPGDLLPTEAVFVEQLHVSRAVVRESLRSLESLGVINSRQGEGRYVSSFTLDPIMRNLGYSMLVDVEEVRDILDVRERLESSYIGDAIDAMTPETLQGLRKLISDMRVKASVGDPILQDDLEFHRAIFATVGNSLLIKLLNVFWQVYRHLCGESVSILKDPMAEIDKHEAIADAIEARDVALAQRRLAEHFDNINERLLSTGAGRGGPTGAPPAH